MRGFNRARTLQDIADDISSEVSDAMRALESLEDLQRELEAFVERTQAAAETTQGAQHNG